MKGMVESGEADHLVAERVWQEFSKGLAEPRAELMFEVMQRCGFLEKAFPEIKRWPKAFAGPLPVRFALLTWPLDESQVEALCERLRAPNEVRELALTACRSKQKLASATPEGLLDLLKGADALRRPERFAQLLEVARFQAIDTARAECALRAAAGVDAGAIAAQAASQPEIPKLLDAARLQAIRSLC
jgi:tRNA nucleotidyltransferase (CCA-adding enzyme)